MPRNVGTESPSVFHGLRFPISQEQRKKRGPVLPPQRRGRCMGPAVGMLPVAGPLQLQPRDERADRDWRLCHPENEDSSQRQSEHLVLSRPCDRRVEQTGGSDAVWQPALDRGCDQARCQEGE